MAEDIQAFDVVIAGAGMTGATLALALARSGLSVALVDAQPVSAALDPQYDGRASAIAAASMNQWRALGIAEALEAAAEPIRSILISDGRAPGASGGRGVGPGLLRFDGEDLGEADRDAPLGYMVENRHIRAVLAEALQAAGATLIAPALVQAVQTGARTATVILKDGRTLEAPLVVGAEGRRSAVREALGIRTFGWTYRQIGVVATVALAEPHQGVAHEYFLPNGPLAILPLTDQRASLVWTERSDLAKALVEGSPQAFDAHLARRFGDHLGAPRLVGGRFSFPLALQMTEAITGERTALVGDAAHAIHPIAGQGLNLGLKDVAALAEVIVDARRAWARTGVRSWCWIATPAGAGSTRRPWRRRRTCSRGCSPTICRRCGRCGGWGWRWWTRSPRRGASSCARRRGAMGDRPRLLRGEGL